MTNNNNSQNGSTPLTTKGFAMPIIIAIIAVVLVLGGVVYYTDQSRTQEDKMEQEKTIMKKEGEAMSAEGGSASEGMAKYTGTVLAGKSAPLLDYNKSDYDAAVKSDKLVVLYFYANWCPICKAEFPVMQKAFNELTTDKAIGFRVNYNDDQTDNDEKNLAKQFGVAYQHTKVFVQSGQRILKSPEGWDEKRYDMEISKALSQ